MAARKEFPVKVRRVAVTNKKTGVKYIEERRYLEFPRRFRYYVQNSLPAIRSISLCCR